MAAPWPRQGAWRSVPATKAAPTVATSGEPTMSSSMTKDGGPDSSRQSARSPPPPTSTSSTPLYIVCSEAGKLVYANGDEGTQTWALTQASVIHAMISLFGPTSSLQRIAWTDTLYMAILHRAPLYVACIATSEVPESYMQAQLEYVYLAILSLISKPRLDKLFQRSPNVDVRGLIGPMHAYVDRVVTQMHTTLTPLWNAVPVYDMDAYVREQATKACAQVPLTHRPAHLLYVMLWYDAHLLTIMQPKRHAPSPTDLMLVHAMVEFLRTSPAQDDGSDTWVPMCLPVQAPHGFVYVYASHLHALSLVVVCGDKDGRAACEVYRTALLSSSCWPALGRALAMPPPSIDSLGLPGLRGFTYVSRRHQQVSGTPCLEAQHSLYIQLVCALRGESVHEETKPLPPARRPWPVAAPLHMLLLHTPNEALLGWRTKAFELLRTNLWRFFVLEKQGMWL
ncbi:Mon1-Ccz1 complex protein [Malassezia pachydermatis]|uniref:Vacuolar fusion protein MON1 n=1 Tax=Malassezia pachydermatis TaxID=77020 RepID=A0A0M8MKQ7_9BASI|nr:hypothetical protein Malapachy_4102 [Malassezia pachydermatis]KOS14436.1 hypothetical protein Malapachy_4102 [Malassezia pachydermatis]